MAKNTKAKTQTKVADLEDEDLLDDIDEVIDDDVADDEVIDDDDDGNDDDEDDDDPDHSIDEPAPAPRPKLTKTVIAFILLNWIAVPGFLYLAYANHLTRSQYAYQSLLNYVAIWGLPLKGEDEHPSASNVTREYMRLSPDQLKAALKARGKTIPAKEDFVPVEEEVPLVLRARDIYPALLKDIFGTDLGEPVTTLEDEIERLKTAVPKAIQEEAKEACKNLKTDDEKRDFIRKVLLPIAWDVSQIKNYRIKPNTEASPGLDDFIDAAKGAELDTLADESAQRRMYYDILAPINVFRPGDLKVKDPEKIQYEQIANQKVPVEKIKEQFIKRLKSALDKVNDPDVHLGEAYAKERSGDDRDTIEKRHTIAFIHFALGQVKVPTLDKLLFPKGAKRAETVCGLREFTGASLEYVRTLRVMEERVAAAIDADRHGQLVTIKNVLTRIPVGFTPDYENEVDRIVKLKSYIDNAKNRLDDLTAQRDRFQKLHDQRTLQHKDTLAKLLVARKKTEEHANDLRKLQDQLHQALLELSDAAERNFALEARIRTIEEDLLLKNAVQSTKKKGGRP